MEKHSKHIEQAATQTEQKPSRMKDRHYHWASKEFFDAYQERYGTIRLFTQAEVMDIRRTHGHRETESPLVPAPPHMEMLQEISKNAWATARACAKERNKSWNGVRDRVFEAIRHNIEYLVRLDRRGLTIDETEVLTLMDAVREAVGQ